MAAVIDFLLNHWYVVGPLLLLVAAFVRWFFLPALAVDRNMQQMRSALAVLRNDNAIAPRAVKIADPELSRLWSQYCDTLQIEIQPDWKSLFDGAENHRSTMPAEAIFCGSSVIDGPLHVEFFRHLPGLMTGLGIIGTFGGLIEGLGSANIAGVLKTEVLIASVREAFFVSASAIIAAMLVTFFEKFCYARLHRRLSDLCQGIDGLWVSAMGDDMTPRLVRASEQAAASMGQLNENLVGELRDFLLRLVERQKELGERQDARLQQLLTTLQRSPADGKTTRADRDRATRNVAAQGETLDAEALRKQLAELADKISQGVGGRFAQVLERQLAQAKEGQSEIVKSLEAASLSSRELVQSLVQALAQNIADTKILAQKIADSGERTISAVSEQVTGALDGMAGRQDQLLGAVREMIEELRAQGQAYAEALAEVVAMKEEAEREAIREKAEREAMREKAEREAIREKAEREAIRERAEREAMREEASRKQAVESQAVEIQPGAVKEWEGLEGRRLTSGAMLNLAETLAQLHPMRASK